MQYGTTEAMTARRDHYGPSQGPSTHTRLDRFSVIRIPLLLGFCFIINSSKNLVFGVRLFVRLLVRLFDNFYFSCSNIEELILVIDRLFLELIVGVFVD